MVKLIIWIVIALLALSFFGISLRGLVEAPQTQDNFHYLASLLHSGWDYIVAWFHGIQAWVKNTVHLPSFSK